jgi:hypothetical protein
MQTKQLLSSYFITACIAFAFFSTGCESNDYDDSTDNTTVSPSPGMHMNPGSDHSMMDSTHMMSDSTMMHDTMMHQNH